MTYATIIAHLELGQPNAGLLQAARALADRFEASVIGMAACQPMTVAYADGFSYGALIEQDQTEIATQIGDAEAEFRTVFGSQNRSLEWRASVLVTSLADHLAVAARAADLIVTTATAGNTRNGTPRLRVGDLAMQAGRPVLVVPATPQDLALDRLVIAWKDTREARRAVADALPLLQKASHVGLVEIAEEWDLEAARTRLGDVAAWLGRHGIAAKPLALASTGDAAARLNMVADDQGAGIIVAGAYGHSRLREWALGGMTRSLLQSTSRCSFLSH